MKALLKRHGFSLSFLLLVLVAAYALQTDKASAHLHEFGGATMGTSYRVKVVDAGESPAAELLAQEIGELLRHLDRDVMSTYAEDSELSKINKAAVGETLSLSRSMSEVIGLALEINALTSGAFDVTVGPLVNRWGFGPAHASAERIPSQAEIDELLSRVGSHYLQWDSQASTLRKDADVYIDLSGIAKGYGVDQVAEYLDSRGFANYFIEVGGELRIKGYKPGNVSWVPAIETPVDSAPQVYEVFYAKGQSIAVAGSGDYRNYFDVDGVHYSHEIDPASGRPATHNLAAVYVIAATAARADALATAFMVMGVEQGFALAQQNGLAAYFIMKSETEAGFDELYSSGFAAFLSPD